MIIKEFNDFIRVYGINIDFENTFNSGQCFRWNREDNIYIGVVNEKIVIIDKRSDDEFDLYNVTPDEFKKYFYWYFDLDKDYEQIKSSLKKHDPLLRMAIEKYPNLRLLNQEPFECMISFIISQNNNIKRIKLIIEKLCSTYGKEIEYKGYRAYAFPSPNDLKNINLSHLQKLGLGYRALYVYDAIKKINAKEVELEKLFDLEKEDAKAALMTIKGVGNKVSECVLLYSLQKYNAFPVDVWIKRALNKFYNISSSTQIKEFIESFGDLAGYAQLFLFHYIRNVN